MAVIIYLKDLCILSSSCAAHNALYTIIQVANRMMIISLFLDVVFDRDCEWKLSLFLILNRHNFLWIFLRMDYDEEI